jgi:hypothetical protein
MKVIGYDELRPAKGIPYSQQWLRQMIKDGKFPKPIKLASALLASLNPRSTHG